MTTATATKLWPMKRVRYGNQRLWVPIIDKPYTRILRLINRKNFTFDICTWLEQHDCKTVCCIGGGTMFLAGDQGKKLSWAMDNPGDYRAAQIILEVSSDLPVPPFDVCDYSVRNEHEANRKAWPRAHAGEAGACVLKILDKSKVADNRYRMMQKVGPAIIQAQLANPTPEGDQGMIEALCFLTALTYMKVRGIEYINETNEELATRILVALER